MKQRGFGFLEMILYMGILAVFISGAIQFAWSMIYGRLKGNVQQEVSDNLRLAVARIAFEVRNASDITSVTGSTLTLANTDAARNPTVFDVTGGRLRIGYGSGGSCPTTSPCPLTTDRVTTAVSFTNLTGTGTKNVRFTVTVTSAGGVGIRSELARTESFTSAAEVRSY